MKFSVVILTAPLTRARAEFQQYQLRITISCVYFSTAKYKYDIQRAMCHVRLSVVFALENLKRKKKSSNFHLNNFRPHLNLPAKAAVITLNTYFTHRISISKWVLYTQNITYCSKIEKRIWFQMCTLGVYIISSRALF